MRSRIKSGWMTRAASQRGQSLLAISVIIALFLLAVLGVAADYGQLWAHRQMAQVAADSACQAGAYDLYRKWIKSDNSQSWIPSSPDAGSFTCSTYSSSPPCFYADKNGYSGSNVAVSFPSS